MTTSSNLRDKVSLAEDIANDLAAAEMLNGPVADAIPVILAALPEYQDELLAIDSLVPREAGDNRSVYSRMLELSGAKGPQSTVQAVAPTLSEATPKYCKDCGAKESEHQREYDKDCACGGAFSAPEAGAADAPPLDCQWMSYALGGNGWCACGRFGSEKDMRPYAAWEQHIAGNPEPPATIKGVEGRN